MRPRFGFDGSPKSLAAIGRELGLSRQRVRQIETRARAKLRGFVNAKALHFHGVFLEGVSFDRTDQGLKPRLVKGEPPSDTDIAAMVHKISRRVMRALRRLGYLEADIEAAMATGYDPLRHDEPDLARTMAASVQQRIACGEQAGQQVRRIGAGFGTADGQPTLSDARGASVHGFSLHANTHVPAHRREQLQRLIRSTTRGAVSLERLTQDANGVWRNRRTARHRLTAVGRGG